MGHDTRSVVTAGVFMLRTDWDHKGSYRGHQAMEKGKYRGSHYHVEGTSRTQAEIKVLLEDWLRRHGAVEVHPEKLGIGNAEFTPASATCWELNGKQTVLWISGFNGALHVETNKTSTFKPGILTKPLLVEILEGIP